MAGETLRKVKCTLVGDYCVGKTSMLVRYGGFGFPDDGLEKVLDRFSKRVTVDGELVDAEFLDTAGIVYQDRIRVLAFPNTDVFVVCFSVVEPESLASVIPRFVSPIQKYIKHPRIILVGTKVDLSDERAGSLSSDSIGWEAYAEKYMECSAKDNFNIEEVFTEALRIALRPPEKKEKTRCQVL